ncbi:hypothetical protein OH76DRAFT_1411588 [Lentinus brumalis]|uniref:Uncharacterized protein n=1 Tax=Lentinus brumalis TaxID=2498619 RepID=A0A371CNV1_9APHY|nr:hypothetical protein OH76DRAFT_1411588 [Polyporus brumalis]
MEVLLQARRQPKHADPTRPYPTRRLLRKRRVYLGEWLKYYHISFAKTIASYYRRLPIRVRITFADALLVLWLVCILNTIVCCV